jgi:hypothetical protein
MLREAGPDPYALALALRASSEQYAMFLESALAQTLRANERKKP